MKKIAICGNCSHFISYDQGHKRFRSHKPGYPHLRNKNNNKMKSFLFLLFILAAVSCLGQRILKPCPLYRTQDGFLDTCEGNGNAYYGPMICVTDEGTEYHWAWGVGVDFLMNGKWYREDQYERWTSWFSDSCVAAFRSYMERHTQITDELRQPNPVLESIFDYLNKWGTSLCDTVPIMCSRLFTSRWIDSVIWHPSIHWFKDKKGHWHQDPGIMDDKGKWHNMKYVELVHKNAGKLTGKGGEH